MFILVCVENHKHSSYSSSNGQDEKNLSESRCETDKLKKLYQKHRAECCAVAGLVTLSRNCIFIAQQVFMHCGLESCSNV